MSELAINQETEVKVQEQPVNILSIVDKIASSGMEIDVAKIEKLLDMQERISTKEAETKFNKDLADMQSELPVIGKDKSSHNGKYATLQSIQKVITPVLSGYGFAVRFETNTNEQIEVTAILTHISGHSAKSKVTLPKDDGGKKSVVQQIGSSITYGQRYALKTLLNLQIADDIDDNNGVAGGMAQVVTPQQAKALMDKIRALGVDLVEFLTAFGAASIDNFPAQQFNTAIAALNKKTAQKLSTGGSNG